MRLPDPGLPWPIPMAAVLLVAEAESCRLRSYKCPAGVWTCGWGATEGVEPGMQWSQEQADKRLCADLTKRTSAVEALLTEHADPNQLGALVSLAYNIGTGALAKSTVLKAHNRGDAQAASRAFGLWNKATVGGKLTVLAGLTARRAAEAALYLKPEPDAPAERMPQAVQAESNLAKSQIAQGGAATAGVGILMSDLPAQITPIKAALDSVRSVLVDTLGIPTQWLVPAVLVAAGVAIVVYRARQRKEGWA
jgi:lysozyme